LDKKKCEYCGELIHVNTRRCPFCGSIVSEVPLEIIKAEEDPSNVGELTTNNNEKEQPFVTQTGFTSEVRDNQVPQKPLSNAMKVFITVLACIIPGFGQLIGIIVAVVFMSDEADSDRRSFGKALMIASLVIFVVISICCVLYGVFAYGVMMANPELRIK